MKEKHDEEDESGANPLDYLLILLKYKRSVIKITGLFVIIGIVTAFVSPQKFTATTRIVSQSSGVASLATTVMGQMPSLGGMFDMATKTDLFASMLESNTLVDRIIDRFGLMEAYGVKYREDARRLFSKNTMKVETDKKSGVITISITTRSPERSASIANSAVEELKALNSEVAAQEAGERKKFFEEQLRFTKVALTNAEDSLKDFQDKTGALQIDEQTRAVIKGISELRASITVKEVQLRVLQSYSTGGNPDVQKLQQEVGGLKAALAKLESKGDASYNPLAPTGKVPDIGRDYIRKIREMKYNEALYELLYKQFEAAKIDEANNASAIQIIDIAKPPTKRSKPKRSLIVIAMTMVGFIVAAGSVVAREYYEKHSGDEDFKRYSTAFAEHVPSERIRSLMGHKYLRWMNGLMRHVKRFINWLLK